MPKNSEKSYLTPNEVARLLMVSPVTVRQWAQKGELKALTTPGGHRRFLLQDVADFARSRGIKLNELPDHETRDQVTGELRVLVVDDDEQLAEFLTDFLESCGYPITTEIANDGFEAGRKVQIFKPHVILLDLMMPGINGFEVCETLKKDSMTTGIRIVAMTGYRTQENVDRITAAGAEVCLAKPLDTMQLLDILGVTEDKRASNS